MVVWTLCSTQGSHVGSTSYPNKAGGVTLAVPHAGVHWVMLGWTKTKDFDLTWLRKDLARP